MNKATFVPLIPSYKPDEKLPELIDKLQELGFTKIIVVNDGSPKEYLPLFDALKKRKGVFVVSHASNKGKGKAIKTGLTFYQNEFKRMKGVITVDSDGQHLPSDVLNIADYLELHDNVFVLGTRNFNGLNVPVRSKMGNRFCTRLVKLKYGVKIRDTQTGLRGFHNALISPMLKVPGDRFEYEMNVLMAMINAKVKIKEVPIKTVYIDNNESSHYDPLKDLVRIWKTIMKSKGK